MIGECNTWHNQEGKKDSLNSNDDLDAKKDENSFINKHVFILKNDNFI